MKFAIKTMNRVDTLKKMTLQMLEKYGVDHSDIYLFVSTDKCVKDYGEAFPSMKIIRGPRGIVEIDNFIVNYFEPGEKYIYLNDDIRRLNYAVDTSKLKEVEKDEFLKLAEETFKTMEEKNISYAGCYPVANPYFMRNAKHAKTYDFKLITDPFSFNINNRNVQLTKFFLGDDFNENIFSDYEKSILHYQDRGSILRLTHYCADVLYFNGATTSNRTKENSHKNAELFLKRYPKYINSIKKNKNGFCSIKFKKIKSEATAVSAQKPLLSLD